jgi:16S rRNA processing protein RimM
MSDPRILVATIGRPHGVRGLVRLHAATSDAASVETLGPLHDAQGRAFTIRWRGVGIAEITDGEGRIVADRDVAAKLVNVELFAARDALPEPDEDEFYHADLIGMAAVDPDGTDLGVVTIVHDYGAGVSLELRGARTIIVPFTRACVPKVDLAARRVTVVEPDEIELEGDLQLTGAAS